MLPLKLKEKRKEEKVLPFHTPSTGLHQFTSPSQQKEKNRKKGVVHWKQETEYEKL